MLDKLDIIGYTIGTLNNNFTEVLTMTIKQLISCYTDFNILSDTLVVFEAKDITIIYDGNYYHCPQPILERTIRSFGHCDDSKDLYIEVI